METRPAQAYAVAILAGQLPHRMESEPQNSLFAIVRKEFRMRQFSILTVVALLFAASVAAQSQAPPQNPPATEQKSDAQDDADRPKLKTRPANQIMLAAGTQLPLVLHNTVSTRNAKKGDPIYLETLFPITQDSKIIIPAGSYVHGEIVEAKRPGKVKGRGELIIRLDTLILPNGYTVSFNAIPSNAGTGGNETVEEEGKVKGDTDRANDAGTVLRTTTMGGGIGTMAGAAAGNVGRGAGIGLGVGAAAGLLTMLMTRGPEVELPRGTTLDVTLDRPLYLDAERINFTDPGRASSLAGPPNRQPVRTNRFPY
jgi:type IV secretion system protein VirB10